MFLSKIGIIEEVQEFHLRFWETPSFLFLLLGILTGILVIITYAIASHIVEPEVVIASMSMIAILSLFIGGLIVRVLSRILIVDRAKSEFLSLASHQLRTPLSGVKWALDLVLREQYGVVSARIKNILHAAYESNERMIILVEDILNVSRIESDQEIFDKQSIRLEQIVDMMLTHAEQLIQEKKLHVQYSLPRDPFPSVYGDAMKLSFVIQNLLDNAIKYTPKGGTISLELTAKGEYVIFRIEDSGIGIPYDQQGLIFSKFFRADNAVMDNIGGSGLGLYIVKMIAEKHNCNISFTSRLGKGTMFTLTVPIYRGQDKKRGGITSFLL